MIPPTPSVESVGGGLKNVLILGIIFTDYFSGMSRR